MADSYVCSGATMKCSMGTSQAKLTVLPSRTVFLTGQPMANISDHLSMVNLSPFGRCRSLGFPATASATAANHGTLTPMPCMHNTPFPWMGGKNDYIVKGDPALLKSSTCQCMWGGTISIIDDGQHGEGTKNVQKKEREEFNNDEIKNTASGSVQTNFHSTPNTNKHTSKRSIEKFRYSQQQMQTLKSRLKSSKGLPMSDKDADDKNANPLYFTPRQDHSVEFNNKESLSHRVNCTITTPVFMLRKRGYNVTAKGYSHNNNTSYLAHHPFDAWKNKDGTKAEPIKIKDIAAREKEGNPINSKTQIYYKVLSNQCKVPGYYQLLLTWNDGTRHSTIIKSEQRNINITQTTDGIERITESTITLTNIEPQSGESLDISTLFEKMAEPAKMSSEDFIMRIDDKEFNTDYLDILNFNTLK